MATLNSDVHKLVVRFVREKLREEVSTLSEVVFHNNYLLEEFRPEPEILTIDGHKRSIYPVYLIRSYGFEHMEIQPERLGNKGVLNKLPLKVYVQVHVLERMYERLGRHFVAFNYNYITLAIGSKDIVAAGSKNSYLFPLTYNNTIKVGYLKGDIIGGKLLIRTFLFLTNNGTPEGKKLQELIGLEKEDKKYLGIDQLSTFINSDIRNNEKLKNLFTEAGCGGLFSLDKNILGSQKKEVAIADFLSQYIGLGA